MDTLKQIDLPKITDPRGNLSFFQNFDQIPFEMKRIYWIYDVPGGEKRGSHAFRNQCEFIVALSGSFDVVLDNGTLIESIGLNRSYKGVFVPKLTWRTLENFSTNSLALIVSDADFDENDYIRDYSEFINITKNERDRL